MGLIDRVDQVFDPGKREFVVGEGAISRFERTYGKDPQEWSPSEYGEYIATSNSVYVCSTIRADLLKSLPLRLYKRTGGSRKRASGAGVEMEEVTKGPIVDLLRYVNPFWTFRRLLAMTELSLGLWGKSFWFLERGENGTGEPREIWWARPDRVAVVPDPKTYVKGFAYIPVDGMDPIPFSPDETIWFRYPNPLDEYEGLSPIAAARLAADTGSAAMKSNRNLFAQGLQMGGLIVPKTEGLQLSDEQAKDLEEALDRRFKGVDKAHKWGVLRFDVEMKGASSMGISPKDAEFMGLMKWSLEDVARAYKIPLDLVGGERTYANVESAERAVWIRAIKPETEFLSDELTEQLLTKFPGSADIIEFDLSGVEVLQEAEKERWERSQGQIKNGVITINEYRKDSGKDPLDWGDSWWAPLSLVPVSDAEGMDYFGGGEEEDDDAGSGLENLEGEEDEERSRSTKRVIEYGSDEHKRLFRRFERRISQHEKKVTEVTVDLFERLKDSVLDLLKARAAEAKTRGPEQAAIDPFDLTKWIRIFREAIRPVFRFIVDDAGEDAFEDLPFIEMDFDVDHPAARRFIEMRSQRFAERVPETTWKNLQESISEGMSEGEAIKDLEKRVVEVMDDRIRSTPETIARTEAVGAYNGGTLVAWEQSGVVARKGWLAALDDRTRDSHIEAHKVYQAEPILLSDDFHVGDGWGPAPGQIGIAKEDINCRCTMIPELAERTFKSNGRGRLATLVLLAERLEGVGNGKR